MTHALDLGIGVDEFWSMTPRAIIMLVQEAERSRSSGVKETKKTSAPASNGVVRLNYIPRP